MQITILGAGALGSILAAHLARVFGREAVLGVTPGLWALSGYLLKKRPLLIGVGAHIETRCLCLVV